MKTSKYAQDTVLVNEYLNGKESAIELLVNKYKNKVYTTIYMIVKDKFIAEDLMQETFIKAINRLKGGSYNESGKFGPWVTRIAYNLGIDHFRRQKRYPTINVEENDNIFNTTEFTEESIEAVQIKQDTVAKLRGMIDSLPEVQKEVLQMRHFADMSFKEIAEATGVSINTALGRMRYAIINLRKQMEQTNIVYDETFYSR